MLEGSWRGGVVGLRADMFFFRVLCLSNAGMYQGCLFMTLICAFSVVLLLLCHVIQWDTHQDHLASLFLFLTKRDPVCGFFSLWKHR